MKIQGGPTADIHGEDLRPLLYSTSSTIRMPILRSFVVLV